MGNQKDDPRVIEFMRLFHELRDWTGDAAHLSVRAPNEASLKQLCYDIDFSGLFPSTRRASAPSFSTARE